MTEWKEIGTKTFWNAEKEGDELIGEIISTFEGNFGTQYVIQKEDGEEMTTPSHKVLQNRLNECKVGDVVRIVFNKIEPPSIKGNNPTKIYSVYKKE